MSPEARNPTILVADDNAQLLKLLSELFKQEGYEVISAENGNAALEVLLHEPLDLALIDVNMPYWNGIALCRIAKSNPRTRLVPVVLVSGEVDRGVRMEAIQAGADDFVTKPFNVQELQLRVRSLLRLKLFTDEMEHAEVVLFTLAKSIEARDPHTHGHCERLALYSVALAERLGLSEEHRVALHRAGIVHDIGKVALSDKILSKPGPLTSEERQLMETHAVVGETICAPLRTFRLVLPIIRHHHEKMDGTGYPDRLEGDQIPLSARILTTVDVYDALTTDRPYRKALPVDKALEIMHDDARLGVLDTYLLAVFESLILDPSTAILKRV